MRFADSLTCRSGRDCRRCRSEPSFRVWLAGIFELPGRRIDFECPFGKAWGYGGGPRAQPSRGLGDTIAKVTSKLGFQPCGGCKQRQETLNRSFPYNR